MARTRDGSGLFCAQDSGSGLERWTGSLLAPFFPSSSIPLVILNLFQDNRRRWLVMLNQVQHDDRGGQKNHFPTNNHIGYSSRVMQAAVRNAGRDDGNAGGETCWHGRRDRVRASA